MSKYSINYSLMANRRARRFGTNRATEIIFVNSPRQLRRKDGSMGPLVKEFDRYHAESRTGIRAGMAALKRFWSTYHYVPTVCIVKVPDIDAIYSNDNH